MRSTQPDGGIEWSDGELSELVDFLDKPIARGRTADVYELGDTLVVKLFREGVTLDAVELERTNAAIARSIGVNVPVVHRTISRDGRIGLIFDRVLGTQMMDVVLDRARDQRPSAELLAELHLDLNAHGAPSDLPDQGVRMRVRIASCEAIAAADRRWLLEALDDVPIGEQLCHGDFHPGNVILTSAGPVIIDWVDASRGSPAADLARTSLLFRGRVARSAPADAMAARMSSFHADYVRRYLNGSREMKREYERWLPFVAAARLSEGIAEQRDWLIEQVRAGVADARSSPKRHGRESAE